MDRNRKEMSEKTTNTEGELSCQKKVANQTGTTMDVAATVTVPQTVQHGLTGKTVSPTPVNTIPDTEVDSVTLVKQETDHQFKKANQMGEHEASPPSTDAEREFEEWWDGSESETLRMGCITEENARVVWLAARSDLAGKIQKVRDAVRKLYVYPHTTGWLVDASQVEKLHDSILPPGRKGA
jgi:hypothetical protein